MLIDWSLGDTYNVNEQNSYRSTSLCHLDGVLIAGVGLIRLPTCVTAGKLQKVDNFRKMVGGMVLLVLASPLLGTHFENLNSKVGLG
ncbi:hypothetical protein C5167_020881, partial [Papaver somniferum]